MRLDPPPKHTMRVRELAKDLGWPAARLVEELRSRGEWVKSASSTIEAPVVWEIRRDFAAAKPEGDPDQRLDPRLYGESADLGADTSAPEETFAEAFERIKSEPPHHQRAATRTSRWRPAILQALLDEVVTQRPAHAGTPNNGGHFGWELKKAENLHIQWAKARLNGLPGDDPTIIEWIRLSGGQRPRLAAELSDAGIAPTEAALRLGYGGRIDPRMAPLYTRFRDRRITRSEVITAVWQWRQNTATG